VSTPAAILRRTTFQTSRLLEFFSEKELSMQIGHPPALWPLALLKELIDNGLDACEIAGVQPQITVAVKPDSVSVQDNGPGLPAATLERSLDYLVRVSDKNHYVSPTRGQLGNALKCVWASPFVVDGEHGRVTIDTASQRHTIDVRLDRIAQEPKIEHAVDTNSSVQNGTRITLHWPEIACSLDSDETSDFYNGAEGLLDAYSAFNPHADFMLGVDEDGLSTWHHQDADWKHWLPNEPTSPHWYTPERLVALIAAYLAEEERGGRTRTVREFITEFRGLSGTAKQKSVTAAAGLSGATLRDLVVGDDVDHHRVANLLQAMQDASRIVQPALLGCIGDHMRQVWDVRPESIRYSRKQGIADGMPYVLETALGVCDDADLGLLECIGLNSSPTIGAPFRQLGSMLGASRVDPHDPIALLIHVTTPRLEFTDRGKGMLA
jgi:DNA topoisomerase VI subunit B